MKKRELMKPSPLIIEIEKLKLYFYEKNGKTIE